MISHSRAPGSNTTLALAIGVLAVFLSIAEVASRYVPQTWIQRDGRFYTTVNVTLVEDLSVDQGEFCASWYSGTLGWNRNLDAAWSNVARGRNGEHLPKHPILLPLLSTPLFWAFGLHGTLIFNLLLFVCTASSAFALARRHASVAAAAFAALALLFATGIREHVYDYHVDVLMLALFSSALALIYARWGFWAGVLLGATVVLRPTALIWLPSLALIVAERRDWQTLRRALVGGTTVLVLFALSNTWLYGRPWWSGYNRVIIVVNGEPTIADVSDAFSVPLSEGLQTLWKGPYGVSHRLTLIFAAIPGVIIMLRKRPGYAIAAAVGTAASVVLFAKYRWYGDRFLWPSCALLIPALAVSVDALARLLRRATWWRPALVAALASISILIAHAVVGAPLVERLHDGSLIDASLNILIFAPLAFGLTRAAERAGAGSLAIAAPLALLLLPEVRDRVLAGGADLNFATALCLSLGARHWAIALFFASLAAWIGVSAELAIDPLRLVPRLDEPTGRWIVVLLASAFLSVRSTRAFAFLLLALTLLVFNQLAGLGVGKWPLFALALLCLPLPIGAARAADRVVSFLRDGRSRAMWLVGSALLALFLIGFVPRIVDQPFRIASYDGVRNAEVLLGDVPCDFLAWEHLNWECSTLDQGVHGETGLATSQPLHVNGRRMELFLVSTQRGRARTVRWHRIPATATLALRWAVPDELTGGGALFVRVDNAELASLPLPRAPDGTLHTERFDTRAYDGREVTLELELRGAAGVVVDGGFVH